MPTFSAFKALPQGTRIFLHSDIGYAQAGDTYEVTWVGTREARLENVKRHSATYVRDWELRQASYSVVGV